MLQKTVLFILGVLFLFIICALAAYYFVLGKQPRTTEPNLESGANIIQLTDTPSVPVENSAAKIKDCTIEPNSVTAKLNDEMIIFNDDDTDHIIKVDDSHAYTLDAKSSGSIFVNFNNEPGEFPFTCDGKPSGTFVINTD